LVEERGGIGVVDIFGADVPEDVVREIDDAGHEVADLPDDWPNWEGQNVTVNITVRRRPYTEEAKWGAATTVTLLRGATPMHAVWAGLTSTRYVRRLWVERAARADAFDRETSRDGDDVSTDDAVDDGSAKGALDAPIPRTKGTCVTREARAPPFEWPSDPIVPVANGGQWRELADALAAEASNTTTDLVLVGDSITEAWRGTSLGAARAEYASAPEILARRLGEYSPLPLAIAGDTTGNVLWRLRNGGFPTPKREAGGVGSSPAYAVLLIGTNDLSRSIFARRSSLDAGDGLKKPSPACVSDDDVATLFAEGVPETVAGILAVVEALVELAPETKIVVLGITPRGERVGSTKVSYLQPSVWSAAIDATNAVVERVLENGKRKGSGKGSGPFGGSRRYRNVVFQPCAEPFLVRDAAGGGKRVDERLMRDGLHPNGAGGFDALGECVVDGVEKAKRTR